MLNGRGLGRFEERQGRGPSIFQPVILSLAVPFDSLQPSEYFAIQDGGRNSRTKD